LRRLLCRLGLHDWEWVPTGWGAYTVRCRRCAEEYSHLRRGDA